MRFDAVLTTTESDSGHGTDSSAMLKCLVDAGVMAGESAGGASFASIVEVLTTEDAILLDDGGPEGYPASVCVRKVARPSGPVGLFPPKPVTLESALDTVGLGLREETMALVQQTITILEDACRRSLGWLVRWQCSRLH